MADNYILLTGGHSGLGLGVTKKLITPENKIGLIIRNESRKQQVLGEFSGFPQELVDNIDFFYADLSDQEQVRAVAQQIKEAWPRIDRLFNNAAIVGASGQESKLGNELHFEINTLAPIILTHELKPLLLKSESARVVVTVTSGMASRKLDSSQLLSTDKPSFMGPYMQSKQAVMLLMKDAVSSWDGVSIVFVDPGPNKTKMTQSGGTPWIIRNVMSLFFNDPAVGTQRIYDAAFADKYASETGTYITKDKSHKISQRISRDETEALLSRIQA